MMGTVLRLPGETMPASARSPDAHAPSSSSVFLPVNGQVSLKPLAAVVAGEHHDRVAVEAAARRAAQHPADVGVHRLHHPGIVASVPPS
jgi:hypothetical protein